MRVATVEQMRELDRRASAEHAIPSAILMENAGLAAFQVLLQHGPGATGRRWVVVCGLGNNGGDGLVVARKLHSAGAELRVFVLGDPARYGPDAAQNYAMLEPAGVPVTLRPSTEEIVDALAGCDGLVDALLGTGIARDVGGQYAEVVHAINACGRYVLALDIPSGVDGNTGRVRGVAVQADDTVTFGLPKQGNLLQPGAGLGGRLWVTHISFPPMLQESEELTVSLADPAPLPPRATDGHKGSFGDVLVVAGAASYYGAPSFAARAVLKAGAGYSRLAAPLSVCPALAALAPEVVHHPQPETASGSLSVASLQPLLERSSAVDFVVLGPGLSLAPETQALVRAFVPRVEAPLLVDGDALTALVGQLDLIVARETPTVLTPHPGEMARLMGVSTAEVLDDPVTAAREVADGLGCVVVLKGARTLIGTGDGRVQMSLSGNNGLATAGSGDVLTGVIAACYGLGLPFEDAVVTGVFLHGFAGDLAAGSLGPDGMTASDLLGRLPEALRRYRCCRNELLVDQYGLVRSV